MRKIIPGIDYDNKSSASIVSHAAKLLDSTLRNELGIPQNRNFERKGKGSFGEAVELHYFGYEPNSRQEADFNEVGIELKVTPLKRLKNGSLSSKERLSITNINFKEICREEFEDSTLMHKLSQILLMFYEHDMLLDPFDYSFPLIELWQVPDEDLPTIRHDWETIVGKIRDGIAHEISCGDTDYLEACTKGAGHGRDLTEQPFSPIKAKRRNFALKRSYMDSVAQQGIMEKSAKIKRDEEEAALDVEALVKKRFEPYIGLSPREIADSLGFAYRTKPSLPKSFYASLTKRILGISDANKIEEFQKAGIIQRTIRLRPNGIPCESISFPAIRFQEIIDEEWEDSPFYKALTQRFLFVVYRATRLQNGKAKPEDLRLENVRFWTMPVRDLEAHAKPCFEETKGSIVDGDYTCFTKSTDNPCVHVRPHARNNEDTYPTPQGTEEPKKSFWLNARYIGEQLAQLSENAE